nr:hypothetical protein [Tanacetum cinerariifolium]
MSDASSTVTYTSVYTDSEPRRYYGEDLAETGPPRVIADYLADGVDGDDEPFDDDNDDDDTDDKDPEEHPALVDSSTVPIVDLVLPAGDTEALEADEPTHAPGSPIIIPLSLTRLPGAARQLGPIESDLRRCRVDQAGYGITDTWDEIVDTLMEMASTTLEGVNDRVTELDTTVRYTPDNCRTAMLIDREAMYASEAWTFSMDRSSAIIAYEAIEFATETMDKKMLTHAERQAEQKWKVNDTSRTNINNSHLKGIISAPNVERLAIGPVTVKADLLLPTTRGPKGQMKGVSLALNVDFKDTTR